MRAVAFVVAAVALVGCGVGGSREAANGSSRVGWTDLDPPAFAELASDSSVTVVNVHVPYEGELPGTDTFVPYDAIETNLSVFPQDRAAPIALYCRSGRMSTEAARTLTALGYQNVFQLAGGFQAWKRDGRDMIIDPGRTG